jgi:hypothetical protein
MRRVALGCAALLLVSVSAPAIAAPADGSAAFVHDQDGGVMPASEPDPDFVIDPDGGMPRSKANSDRDEDGDVAIYQGQDDNVPC